jgi:hypothetical protein
VYKSLATSKCRSYSSLGSPLSLDRTSLLPPPSERPSLPRQSPQAQSVHAPLTAVAISAAPSSAHITPAVAHPSPVALPILPQPCRATSLFHFLEPPAKYGPLTTTATQKLSNVAQPTRGDHFILVSPAAISPVVPSHTSQHLSVYPREHRTTQMPKDELTLPRRGHRLSTPLLITLWSYPVSCTIYRFPSCLN